MSEVQPPVPAKSTSLLPGQIVISGRVINRRRIDTQEGKRVLTLVRCPAPDVYSHPATLELNSVEPIGAPGDDFTVKCRISGSPRTFQATDRESGEVRTVVTANMYLHVIY